MFVGACRCFCCCPQALGYGAGSSSCVQAPECVGPAAALHSAWGLSSLAGGGGGELKSTVLGGDHQGNPDEYGMSLFSVL